MIYYSDSQLVTIARDSADAREIIRAMGQAEYHSRQRTGNVGWYSATLVALADRLDQTLHGNALAAWQVLDSVDLPAALPTRARRSPALSAGTIAIPQLATRD